jgi:hypothetical protein
MIDKPIKMPLFLPFVSNVVTKDKTTIHEIFMLINTNHYVTDCYHFMVVDFVFYK